MKLAVLAAAPFLLLAACSPPAEQSSAPTVQMSENAEVFEQVASLIETDPTGALEDGALIAEERLFLFLRGRV